MTKNKLYNFHKECIPSYKNNYIAIFGENVFECLQLILWGRISNLKMLVILPGIPPKVINILKHVFFIRKYIEKSIKDYKASLSSYKGLWYEANEEAIDLTLKFYNQQIKNKSKFISYYNKILNTDKFEAFVKKRILNQIFALLKDLHIVRLSKIKQNKLLINKNPINDFVINHMEDKYKANYQIRWIISSTWLFHLWVYYIWLFKQFIYHGVTLNRNRKKYKISKEATWNFYQRTLRDDILIDNGRFKMNDLLILEFITTDIPRIKALKEAKKRGFDTASVPKLKININKNIIGILFFYFLVPLKTFFQLLLKQESYLFHYIFLFHRECFPVEMLMNLYDIKYNLSINDYDDITTTIILNKYGTKNVIFHWSDLTSYKAYNKAFIAHNIYFVWGDIHYDYHSATYYIDNKIKIGCIYKKEYNKAMNNKERIIEKIDGFKIKRKTVTFCDTSFDISMGYTEYFFLEYLEIIKEFCERNRDINVLLKPKKEEAVVLKALEDNIDRYKKIWKELLSFDNFIYLNPLKWKIEDIIAISDICVSMGMNSPSTIALICGRNALYFDNTGNNYHPFAKKYKNLIVFEDKDLLFRQIDNILNQRFNCKDAISEKEFRDYDAFKDDKAFERLKDTLYKLAI